MGEEGGVMGVAAHYTTLQYLAYTYVVCFLCMMCKE